MPDPQSTSKQLPMIAPNGDQGMVDQEGIQSLVNQGYKPAIQMRAPNGGTKGFVALSDMGQALKAGYMTEGQYQQSIPAPDANSGGILNSGMRFLTGAGHTLADAAKGLYHATDPQPGVAGVLQSLAPGGPVGYNMLVKPQIDAVKQGLSMQNSPDPATRVSAAGHILAGLTPGVGPIISGTSDAILPDVVNGNYAGAAGKVASTAALAYLTGKLGGKLAGQPIVPGQNYTPAHAAAFEGLTAKAGGMGPNFIPQNLTSDALSPIRQSTADMLASQNPIDQGIAKAAIARSGDPLAKLGAVQTIIQRSLTNLEDQHTPALAQVAQTPVDMRPIQQGLQGQIKPGMSAADIAGINELIQRAGQIQNLGDLNNFRQIMNEEASPSYRQTPTRAGQASAPQSVATDTANAVRAHYFDQMQQATGTDFQPLKAKESQLLTAKEAVERLQSPEAKAEATFNAPSTIKESLGNVANIIKEPRATVTQTILRESPATRAAMLIRKSLTNLPEPTPQVPQTVGPVATNAPQLPANATPTMVQGTPVPQPPPSAPLQQRAAPSQPQLPTPTQPQLPAGSISRFLTESASPATAASGYPSLNEATARTVVQPNPANPTPGPLGRRLIVDAQGNVVPEPYPLESEYQRVLRMANDATARRMAKAGKK